MDHHALLAEHNGWLVVDEAFMDSTPEQSISPDLPLKNLIVLRSVGKFFGLAGIRAGFVLAEEKVLQVMREHFGPWSISAFAREVSLCRLGVANDKQEAPERSWLSAS